MKVVRTGKLLPDLRSFVFLANNDSGLLADRADHPANPFFRQSFDIPLMSRGRHLKVCPLSDRGLATRAANTRTIPSPIGPLRPTAFDV